ncbi:outer membrane protein assembly factor BamB family protein [Streptomyces sp. NBC_01304]|uniref:outer membrane protein assembly factor BamB family protein n=1 Tax=Streptomyces sp. NBC_01304 TaxID=2903818 RepID=UPI002E14314F|nr:PQQ-like beta-propeller repeat protein [Streptomyces sp. NBC_01304]
MSKGPAQPPAGPPPAAPVGPPPAAPAGPPPAQPGPGYGYPQGQPPQQPQPPQAPQQPQPVADNPYAQQAQPGAYNQQPQYGYPQQPQFPGAPVPGAPGAPGVPAGPVGGGPGGFFKGKPAVIVGAALAALLVIGGGVYFAVSGDDEKPKEPVAHGSGDPEPKGGEGRPTGEGTAEGRNSDAPDLNAGRQAGEAKAWMALSDQDLPGRGAELMDIWVVDDTVVQAGYKAVTAWGAEDGKKKWSVPLDAPVCDTPPTPGADGKVVVAYESGNDTKKRCNQLQMIDLKTGEAGWKKKIDEGDSFDSTITLDLSISENTLLVARSLSGAGYSLDSGEELFSLKKDKGCFPGAFASTAAKAVVVDSCAASDDKNEQLKEIDPTSGAVKWRFKTPKGYQVQKVYSVDPLVVSLVNRDKKAWTIQAFKSDGQPRSQIDGGKDTFLQRCGMTITERELQSCMGMVASGDTFYMATEEKKSGDYDRSNEVVAFDLDTGKAKWRGKADGARSLLPLYADGSGLVAYVQPTFDTPGQTVRFGKSGGKPTVLLQHPKSAQSQENNLAMLGQTRYLDGRFYGSPSRLSGQDDSDTGQLLSFGK